MKKTINDLERDIDDWKYILDLTLLYLPIEQQNTIRWLLGLDMYDEVIKLLSEDN